MPLMDGNWRFFRNQWHEYCGGYWRAHKNLSRQLKRFMIDNKARGVKPTKNKAASIEWFAQADLELEDDSIVDHAPEYINLRNGLFNLKTMELEPHRRDMYMTAQMDFDYDPDAECPAFDHFLKSALVTREGTPDWQLKILVLQALGYTLTADTSRKVSFWLVGESGTGKSTLIGLIRDLMGSLHTTIDLNQLATNRFLLAQVAGKRAVTCTEADAGMFLADGIYKTLVGGADEIVADVKNKEPIKFVPQTKVWWGMNSIPRNQDRSNAVYGRVIIIPFNRPIPPGQRDLQLQAKLRAERSGIFNLAISGLKRLQSGDWEFSAQSEAARDTWRSENDTELAYLQERGTLDNMLETQATELYQDYKAWCEENGFRPKNRNQMTKEWERLGLSKTHKKQGDFWIGVELKKH